MQLEDSSVASTLWVLHVGRFPSSPLSFFKQATPADQDVAGVRFCRCYITTSPGSASAIATDISIGVANGAAAVPYILQRVRHMHAILGMR